MVIIALAMIFSGLLICVFSFILKPGKNNFDKEFSEALNNYEKKIKEEEVNEENDFSFEKEDNKYIDNLTKKSDNIEDKPLDIKGDFFKETVINDEFYENDDEFFDLMKQTRTLIRFVGGALVIVGVVLFII